MTDPYILAVVSGKGGVGKTMLSVAIASELSRGVRTLLIDLDFFNRGLTGLLAPIEESKVVCKVGKPGFLTQRSSIDKNISEHKEEVWNIIEVETNLFQIRYGDLTEDEIRKFETYNVAQISSFLHEFIETAAKRCGCDAVVLDCHGGPDNSSFAACQIANDALLVSEPDRITLYGTLNFIRQFNSSRSADMKAANFHLVFNKVVPAFTTMFLNRFYRNYLSDEFDQKPLLAIFPLEVHLTKEFEKAPFLTTVYPTSLLARKTRVLLYDLLHENYGNFLTQSIRNRFEIFRIFIRRTLGRPFFLFNFDFVMPAIVWGVIFVAGVTALNNLFFTDRLRMSKEALKVIVHIIALQEVTENSGKFFKDRKEEKEFITYSTAIIESKEYKKANRILTFSNRSYDISSKALRVRLPMDMSGVKTIEFIDNISTYRVAGSYQSRFELNMAILDTRNEVLFFIIFLKYIIEEYGPYFLLAAAIWFLVAILMKFHNQLDVQMTYFFRQKSKIFGISILILLVALWWLPSLGVGLLVHQIALWKELKISIPLTVVSVSILAFVMLNFSYRGVYEWKLEGRNVEGFSRLLFVIVITLNIIYAYLAHEFPS